MIWKKKLTSVPRNWLQSVQSLWKKKNGKYALQVSLHNSLSYQWSSSRNNLHIPVLTLRCSPQGLPHFLSAVWTWKASATLPHHPSSDEYRISTLGERESTAYTCGFVGSQRDRELKFCRFKQLHLLDSEELWRWCITQDYWFFWTFPSSCILEIRKYDVSETGTVPVLR
jgi:hypothetical protein